MISRNNQLTSNNYKDSNADDGNNGNMDEEKQILFKLPQEKSSNPNIDNKYISPQP